MTDAVHSIEPAQLLSAAAGLVYSADTPLPAEHAVVHAVLVNAGAEPGRAHCERHEGSSVHSGLEAYGRQLAGLQVFHGDRTVRGFEL
jgi:hypothetical protein